MKFYPPQRGPNTLFLVTVGTIVDIISDAAAELHCIKTGGIVQVSERIARLRRSQRIAFENRLDQLGLIDFAQLQPDLAPRRAAAPSDGGSYPPALDAGGDLPTVIIAPDAACGLLSWIRNNRETLRSSLHKTGAVLLRGFQVDGPLGFEQCIEASWGRTTRYPGLASSVVIRRQIQGNIYSSTEYSPRFVINLHNECSFSNTWPAQICFWCVTAPTSGGETPIADTRRVLARISRETRDRLTRLNIRYVRNFGYGSSRTWQQAFQTTDRSKVEQFCRADAVTCEWLDGSKLRTTAIRPPLAQHPVTGEQVWFNHIHASHISSLEPQLYAAITSEFAPEELPRNCYYGDGSEFEPAVLQEIRAAYDAETIKFSWQPGDVLILDNMLTAHGRSPFEGPRSILVGMAGLITRDNS